MSFLEAELTLHMNYGCPVYLLSMDHLLLFNPNLRFWRFGGAFVKEYRKKGCISLSFAHGRETVICLSAAEKTVKQVGWFLGHVQKEEDCCIFFTRGFLATIKGIYNVAHLESDSLRKVLYTTYLFVHSIFNHIEFACVRDAYLHRNIIINAFQE